MADYDRCNARKRGHSDLPKQAAGPWVGDGYCKRKAGWGTDHVGQGRCKNHGGANPIKHGRYSMLEREELRELIERFEDEEDPLDIEPELASMRALVTDYIDRYDELVDAIITWNRTREGGRPKRLLDLSDAIVYLEKLAKIAQREKKLRLENAISRDDLLRVLGEMARAVESRVDDEETIEKIKNDWASISLG